jgi:hypothetical protein
MKTILSAAALLVAVSGPVLADEAKAPQAEPAPLVVILPTATAPAPAMTEAPAAAGEEAQSKAAMGGHGCGAKKAVYLTN